MSDADYKLEAPGARSSTSPLRLPGTDSFPRVDDHLVEPEISRQEVIGGCVVEAKPAHAPHGVRHTELDYVVRAHVAPGYRAATDLLTRFDQDHDFASDTAVLKQGIDPETGTRYLEEMAFEVVSEQDAAVARRKAGRMQRRGVRRIFAIFVQRGQVCEWSEESWTPLSPDTHIEDPSLHTPLKVAALLDAAAADDAVAAALIARDNPRIRRLEAEGEARGRAEGEVRGRAEGEVRGRAEGEAQGRAEGEAQGRAEALLAVLEARQLSVTEAMRTRILSCRDSTVLDLWLHKAARASSADEVFTDS